MNSDQLSLSDGAPAIATSYLPNGGLEILEVRIFAGERMGILVSSQPGLWHLLPRLRCEKVLVITSSLSLTAATGLLLAIAVRISAFRAICRRGAHERPSS
jgi:hypothetical protein